MRKAIDVSNFWTPNPISDDEALARMREIKGLGYSKVIAGTQVPSVCYQQLSVGRQAGMEIEAYVQVKWGEPLRPQFDGQTGARWAVGYLPAKRLAIAVEGDPPGSAAQNKKLLSEAISLAKEYSFSPVIYTSLYYWQLWMGYSQDFRSYPLWFARYDNVASFIAPDWRFYGFGGWWKPVMKQYAQNVLLGGANVDLNAY